MAAKSTGNPKKHANRTDALHQQVKDEIEHFPVNLPFANQNQNRQGPAYPAEFYQKDPREEKLHLLRKVAQDWSRDGFQVPLPDDVLDYFVQKKKYVEFANWEKWVQNNFNLSDPSQVQMLKKIMPNYFERRLEYLKKVLGLAYTVHKLKLLGPEDEKDMMLLYEIEKGQVPIPLVEIQPQASSDDQFRRGFFNLRKWLGLERDMRTPHDLGSASWGEVRNLATAQRAAGQNIPALFYNTPQIFQDEFYGGPNGPFRGPWSNMIQTQKNIQPR